MVNSPMPAITCRQANRRRGQPPAWPTAGVDPLAPEDLIAVDFGVTGTIVSAQMSPCRTSDASVLVLGRDRLLHQAATTAPGSTR